MSATLLAPAERAARDPIFRALTLLDCYRAISEDGLAASTAGSMEALEDALAAREDIIPLLHEALERVRAMEPDGLTGSAAAEIPPRLRDLQSIDARFRLAVGAGIQQTRLELEDEDASPRAKLVIATHSAVESALAATVDSLASSDVVESVKSVLRIEGA